MPTSGEIRFQPDRRTPGAHDPDSTEKWNAGERELASTGGHEARPRDVWNPVHRLVELRHRRQRQQVPDGRVVRCEVQDGRRVLVLGGRGIEVSEISKRRDQPPQQRAPARADDSEGPQERMPAARHSDEQAEECQREERLGQLRLREPWRRRDAHGECAETQRPDPAIPFRCEDEHAQPREGGPQDLDVQDVVPDVGQGERVSDPEQRGDDGRDAGADREKRPARPAARYIPAAAAIASRASNNASVIQSGSARGLEERYRAVGGQQPQAGVGLAGRRQECPRAGVLTAVEGVAQVEKAVDRQHGSSRQEVHDRAQADEEPRRAPRIRRSTKRPSRGCLVAGRVCGPLLQYELIWVLMLADDPWERREAATDGPWRVG